MATGEPIMVGMRMRPMVGHEKGQPHCIKIRDNVVSIVGEVADETSKEYAFDHAMDSTDPTSPNYCSQSRCYELMGRRMVDHMMQGYNTCLFCYGQTGTGKTTTLMGKTSPGSEQGLLLRLVHDVFAEVERQRSTGFQTNVKAQMLEVYNEKLYDLALVKAQAKQKIDVHVHPELGVYLTGATETAVESAQDCIGLIEYGNTMKTVRATAMNAQSSRGHTVVKLTMERSGGDDNMTLSSEVYFADLAGRENERTTQAKGERLNELSCINMSLMWLASCIQSLGGSGTNPEAKANMMRRRSSITGGRRKSITSATNSLAKFRNSKLTLLLSNALSGNSRTAMIGTLSPALAHFEESFSTLRFASTVKNIKLEAQAATAVDKESLVKKLQDEVRELKEKLAEARDNQTDADAIVHKLEATEAIAASHVRDWKSLRSTSNSVLSQRALTMRQFGSSANVFGEIDTLLPTLANYSQDPHLRFKLVFQIPPDGKEYSIGSGDYNAFRLPPGLGVRPRTGSIHNKDNSLWINAAQGSHHDVAPIEVNYVKLDAAPRRLRHMDRILFGHSTTFYVFLEPMSQDEFERQLEQELCKDDEPMETLISKVLGEPRASDALQKNIAQHYYLQLMSQSCHAKGVAALRAFLQATREAARTVEEANEITHAVRPASGLHFELAFQTPVLAYGFSGTNLPEFCVRLVQRGSTAKGRWLLIVRRLLISNDFMPESVKKLQTLALKGRDLAHANQKWLLATWTWTKFATRLDIMRDMHGAWCTVPSQCSVDDVTDPWSDYGPDELAQLQMQHEQELLDCGEQQSSTSGRGGVNYLDELHKSLNQARRREETLVNKNEALRQELRAVRAQLGMQNSHSTLADGSTSLPNMGPDAHSRISRIMEVSKDNEALLDRLLQAQVSPARI